MYLDIFTEWVVTSSPSLSSVSVVSTAVGALKQGCISGKTDRPPGRSSRLKAPIIGSMLDMSMIAIVQTAASKRLSPSAISASLSVASRTENSILSVFSVVLVQARSMKTTD